MLNKVVFKRSYVAHFLYAMLLMIPIRAQADDLSSQQVNALRIIRETADSICYSVEQRGSENDKELDAKVQAKISGVLARIAELDVSGSGKLQTENYQGVSRNQLLPALIHSTNCKNDVFHSLVERMVPSLAKAVPVAPGLPTTTQLPIPNDVTMTETTQTVVTASNQRQIGRFKLQLYRCGISNENGNATCLIAISYQAQTYEDQYIDYTIQADDSIGVARFIDNLHDQHTGNGAYFVDGKGKHQQTVNMEKDVPVWLALEFQGPFNDVLFGRIIFRDGKAILHVKTISKQG